MAAGVGSRFGGPKQLEPVGPAGETLIDYGLHDARRAGFERAVLVIREELTERIETVAARHRPGLEVVLAYQPIGPTIPRGTVAAVLAAAAAVDGPFAAVNADDFYGGTSYVRAGDFLRDRSVPANTHAFVALPLHATLSEHGAVVRGVSETNGDELVRLDEVRGIERKAGTIAAGDRRFTGKERVSMNFWAFQPSMMAELRREYRCLQPRPRRNARNAAARDDRPADHRRPHQGAGAGRTRPLDWPHSRERSARREAGAGGRRRTRRLQDAVVVRKSVVRSP